MGNRKKFIKKIFKTVFKKLPKIIIKFVIYLVFLPFVCLVEVFCEMGYNVRWFYHNMRERHVMIDSTMKLN